MADADYGALEALYDDLYDDWEKCEKRIEELERQLTEAKKRADKLMEAEAVQSNKVMELEQENADFRKALEVIRDRDPMYCLLCKRRQEIAQQALKEGE